MLSHFSKFFLEVFHLEMVHQLSNSRESYCRKFTRFPLNILKYRRQKTKAHFCNFQVWTFFHGISNESEIKNVSINCYSVLTCGFRIIWFVFFFQAFHFRSGEFHHYNILLIPIILYQSFDRDVYLYLITGNEMEIVYQRDGIE